MYITESAWRTQAVALRETQLRKLVDELDSFVHSSALTAAAWLAQIDALIFPQRSAPALAPCLRTLTAPHQCNAGLERVACQKRLP